MDKKKPFELLNAINCNEHTEKKNGLTYLSWAWAWAEVKKAYPDANYTIYEDKDGRPYHNDGRTCWVKTGVTIEGLEHIEYLPVMDYRNVSIPFDKVTSMDVNKAIQRSLTKACARHGLGLYIYAGEDLPESETETEKEELAKADPDGYMPEASKKPSDAQIKTYIDNCETVEDFKTMKANWGVYISGNAELSNYANARYAEIKKGGQK